MTDPGAPSPTVDIDMPDDSLLATRGAEPDPGFEGFDIETDDAGAMLRAIDTDDSAAPRASFLSYLRSPVVSLTIGAGSAATVLAAHEAVLSKSPVLAAQCASLPAAGGGERALAFPDEDLSAVGAALEYLYNGEYFPRRLGAARDSGLEDDPSVPAPDTTGAALLRHARVYTLAGRWGLPGLRALAHSKIHRASSTARGELAYARYVYGETDSSDNTLRKPVAAFWAARSHVLRHEAGEAFREMCIEFPQFGFDVLTLVLDMKERGGRAGKREAEGESSGGRGGRGGSVHVGRKRARISQG